MRINKTVLMYVSLIIFNLVYSFNYTSLQKINLNLVIIMTAIYVIYFLVSNFKKVKKHNLEEVIYPIKSTTKKIIGLVLFTVLSIIVFWLYVWLKVKMMLFIGIILMLIDFEIIIALFNKEGICKTILVNNGREYKLDEIKYIDKDLNIVIIERSKSNKYFEFYERIKLPIEDNDIEAVIELLKSTSKGV